MSFELDISDEDFYTSWGSDRETTENASIDEISLKLDVEVKNDVVTKDVGDEKYTSSIDSIKESVKEIDECGSDLSNECLFCYKQLESGDQNVIQPCDCKSRIHFSCLRQWMGISNQSNCGTCLEMYVYPGFEEVNRGEVKCRKCENPVVITDTNVLKPCACPNYIHSQCLLKLIREHRSNNCPDCHVQYRGNDEVVIQYSSDNSQTNLLPHNSSEESENGPKMSCHIFKWIFWYLIFLNASYLELFSNSIMTSSAIFWSLFIVGYFCVLNIYLLLIKKKPYLSIRKLTDISIVTQIVIITNHLVGMMILFFAKKNNKWFTPNIYSSLVGFGALSIVWIPMSVVVYVYKCR